MLYSQNITVFLEILQLYSHNCWIYFPINTLIFKSIIQLKLPLVSCDLFLIVSKQPHTFFFFTCLQSKASLQFLSFFFLLCVPAAAQWAEVRAANSLLNDWQLSLSMSPPAPPTRIPTITETGQQLCRQNVRICPLKPDWWNSFRCLKGKMIHHTCSTEADAPKSSIYS